MRWNGGAPAVTFAGCPLAGIRSACCQQMLERHGDGTGPRPSRRANLCRMCRNIRTLHNFEPPATEQEVRDAALQYVRKISGFTKPSRANVVAFERAVDEVAEASA